MGDDSFHNGAFMLAANFGFYTSFVERKGGPAPPRPGTPFEWGTPDGYEFYLKMGPLSNGDDLYFKHTNPYWSVQIEHPNYDEYWQSRSVIRHLKDITPAVMTTGGWFDAEDLAGPLKVSAMVERTKKGPANMLVMGPWSHGGFSRGDGDNLGNLDFGSKTGAFYREKIEFAFFLYHLKGKGDGKFPRAWLFRTGTNEWRKHETWPPASATRKTLYFSAGGALAETQPSDASKQYDEYISDPAKPVPYVGDRK